MEYRETLILKKKEGYFVEYQAVAFQVEGSDGIISNHWV